MMLYRLLVLIPKQDITCVIINNAVSFYVQLIFDHVAKNAVSCHKQFAVVVVLLRSHFPLSVEFFMTVVSVAGASTGWAGTLICVSSSTLAMKVRVSSRFSSVLSKVLEPNKTSLSKSLKQLPRLYFSNTPIIQDYIPSSSSPSSSSSSTMTASPSAMQTRAENAEARERYLKTNLIRSQKELAQANKKNEDLAAKLEAAEEKLAEYKQAETDRENERKKVEDDEKAAHDAGVARWRDAAASGASLSEQAQAYYRDMDMPPELSLQEQAALWIAKLEQESKS